MRLRYEEGLGGGALSCIVVAEKTKIEGLYRDTAVKIDDNLSI